MLCSASSRCWRVSSLFGKAIRLGSFGKLITLSIMPKLVRDIRFPLSLSMYNLPSADTACLVEPPLDLELGGPPPQHHPGPQPQPAIAHPVPQDNDTADLPRVNAEVYRGDPPPAPIIRVPEPFAPSSTSCSRPISQEISSPDTSRRGSRQPPSTSPGPPDDSSQHVVFGIGAEEPPHPD